ncbi:MAG: caspase family protein [Fimbriimonas sp.]|nr:caspase family protein [Fimbriimonas sp.]
MVGCDYQSSKTNPHLDCPPNDVNLFEHLLKLNPENDLKLVSGGTIVPTKSAILSAFDRQAAACTPSDTFVFFFSGHGETTKSGKTSIVPDGPMPLDYNPDRDFITISFLRSELENYCKAKRALIVLDSCYSGGKGLASTVRPVGSQAGPEIVVFAACGANQQAYQTSDKYSIFTLALSQLVSEDSTSLAHVSGMSVESLQSRLRDRVHELCRVHGQMLQDPVIVAPPQEFIEVFTPSISSEVAEVIKKPLVSIDLLKKLKRGIGVSFKCKEAPVFASRVESLVRQKLLENGYPVFGNDRSLELATVIERASTLEGQKIAADLTDRLLITGDISYTGGTQTVGSASFTSATMSMTVQVMDLQGSPIIEYTTDSDGGPAKGFGQTEDSAVSMVIKRLIDVVFKSIKPQLEVAVTKRMPPIQDH